MKPDEVQQAHQGSNGLCLFCCCEWPCHAYQMAERLATLEAALRALEDVADFYDRTSILDPGLRRSYAQRRRRVIDDARAALDQSAPDAP